LLALLAISAFTGHLNMSLLYSVAFGIGIATAFSFPSVSAIVAQAMTPKQLPVANSIMMGATQIVSFSGPLLAGILIAALSHGGDAGLKEAKGFGAAFLVDFASFVFSIWALGCVRIHAKPAATIEHPNVWQSVAEGLRYFWRGGSLRTLSLYTVTIALLVLGPLQVALPVLAEQMGNGAAGFGILTSSFGAGAIIGTLFFSLKPHFRVRNIGTTILLIDSTIGVLLILIGQISVIWQGAMLLFAIGILAGFLQVMVHSWMQQRVPLSMLGRVMSVFVFMMLGAPLISITISGWLLRTMPAKMLYVGSGMLLLATVLIAGMISSMRTITDFRPSSVNGRSQ
jgi:MFS family permease